MPNVNASGRAWARTFLGLALLVSTIGNIAHTVLADSTISLWLRIPGAVIWPVFTFGAIEIIVRMIWERSWTHNIGRNILLLPAIPAAITSYQHLYSLLGMMGEKQFIAFIGPLAIDGMMIGCTMVLLFTRAKLVQPVDAGEAEARLSVLLAEHEDEDWSRAAEIELGYQMTEIEALPVPVSPAAPRAPRATWDARKVAEMAVDGAKTQEIHDATGAGRSTVDRFRKVAKMLVANPRAEIDFRAEKISAEHVTIMRELVLR